MKSYGKSYGQLTFAYLAEHGHLAMFGFPSVAQFLVGNVVSFSFPEVLSYSMLWEILWFTSSPGYLLGGYDVATKEYQDK